MSITVDPVHTWRSAALSKLPVSAFTVSNPRTPRSEPARVASERGAAGLKTWLETGRPYRPPVDIATAAMLVGQIRLHTELCDLKHQSGLASAAQQMVVLDYDYRHKDTMCEMRSDGEHFPVIADINLSLLDTMDTSTSIDAVSKEIGLKLPRLTATNATEPGAHSAPGAMAYNELESSRYFLVRSAQQDDYGLRLHNLAKIVCHSLIAERLQLRGQHTVEMNKGEFRSVLTAELASLRSDVLEESCWFYIADDLSDEYRAFLTMGAKGLWHYVSQGSETIYSRCVSEVEVGLSNKRINFVRRSGAIPAVRPNAAAYVRILSSPSLATACYYAYADSLGIGLQASQVLLQTMYGPHFWGAHAYLPYKAVHPKTDAAIYLLRAVSSVARLSLGDLNHLIGDMAILSTRVMAGLGSVLTSYTCDKKIALSNVVAALVGMVTDPSTARALLTQVHSQINPGYAGLEWIECFRQDTDPALERAVAAYRVHHGVLTQFHHAPVSILRGLLFTGVEMSNEVPGNACASVPYMDLVVYQIMGSGVLSMQSERLTSADLSNVHLLGAVSAWRALYSWVRYSSVSSKAASPASVHSAGSEPLMMPKVFDGPNAVRFPEVPTTSTGPGGRAYPRAQVPQPMAAASSASSSSGAGQRAAGVSVASSKSGAGAPIMKPPLTTRGLVNPPAATSTGSTVVGSVTAKPATRPPAQTAPVSSPHPQKPVTTAAAQPTVAKPVAAPPQAAPARAAAAPVVKVAQQAAPATANPAVATRPVQQPAVRAGTPSTSPVATKVVPVTPPNVRGSAQGPQSPNSSGSSGTNMSTVGMRL